MPYFFIAPFWLLCIVAGVVLLFLPRLRFLSAYFLLGSTAGLLCSVALSTALLVLLPKILPSAPASGYVLLAGYLGGIGVGGLIGIGLGLLAARKLNLLIARRRTFAATP
jgi:hypothetical protein